MHPHEKLQPALEQKLITIVRSSESLMAALRAVRSLGLSSWCIGAGAVRSLVWDTLHGFDVASGLKDVDVVHFTSEAHGPQSDAVLENRLRMLMPEVHWEVTNQATVHHWFAGSLNQAVPALASLEEGVSTWPEFATCVGVHLNDDDSIGVVAPHGLDDLFGLRVRHNPLRASFAVYQQRVELKRFGERWPLLSIDGGW